MPKNPTRPRASRKKLAVLAPPEKKAPKIRRIDDQELSGSSATKKAVYLLVPSLLLIAAVAAFIVFKPKLPSQLSAILNRQSVGQNPPSDQPPQSTQEAKLVEVYEKQKGIELKNFSPRYSVFENADLGYRFAYPVGFNLNPQDSNVEITTSTAAGKIIVTVLGKSFKVEVSGASGKENVDVLNTAADFIRGTFEFKAVKSYSQSELEKRFGGGNQGTGAY